MANENLSVNYIKDHYNLCVFYRPEYENCQKISLFWGEMTFPYTCKALL